MTIKVDFECKKCEGREIMWSTWCKWNADTQKFEYFSAQDHLTGDDVYCPTCDWFLDHKDIREVGIQEEENERTDKSEQE